MPTTRNTVNNRGTGAGAAGKGFAHAALEYPQADRTLIHYLHETCVDALREALVRFYFGPQ